MSGQVPDEHPTHDTITVTLVPGRSHLGHLVAEGMWISKKKEAEQGGPRLAPHRQL